MPSSTASQRPPAIIDIRHGSGFDDDVLGQDHCGNISQDEELIERILDGLDPKVPGKPRSLPTLLLYDDRGVQLLDRITHLEEYYLTLDEIDILERDADLIIDHIPDNGVLVELDARSLRTTVLLLNALERKRKNITYYALGLVVDELTKALQSIEHLKNVKSAGLLGTYEDGIAFVKTLGPEIPKTLVWLGSSIGSLTREDACHLLTHYAETLHQDSDNFLIGIDRKNDPQEILLAYNDTKGITEEFIMNGLDHANALLGQALLERARFEYYGRYDAEVGRHEAYYRVKAAHRLRYAGLGVGGEEVPEVVVNLAKGELIPIEYSYKWSPGDTARLFEEAGYARVGYWTSTSHRYDLHMVCRKKRH